MKETETIFWLQKGCLVQACRFIPAYTIVDSSVVRAVLRLSATDQVQFIEDFGFKGALLKLSVEPKSDVAGMLGIVRRKLRRLDTSSSFVDAKLPILSKIKGKESPAVLQYTLRTPVAVDRELEVRDGVPRLVIVLEDARVTLEIVREVSIGPELLEWRRKVELTVRIYQGRSVKELEEVVARMLKDPVAARKKKLAILEKCLELASKEDEDEDSLE